MTYCDGSLVLVGGIDFESNVLRDVWRSDDDGETWTQVLDNGHTQWANYDMSGGIRDHAMVTLGTTIFIVGGRSNLLAERNGDVYYSKDKGANWHVLTAGIPPELRVYAPAVAGYGNKLYVFGGGNASPTATVTIGTWDSGTETFSWSTSSSLPIALREACACIVPPVAPETNPTMMVLFGETSTVGVFSNLALVAVDEGPIVTWTSHMIGTARPRAAAQCVYDASSNCVVVMGGGEPNADFQRQHNDIWVAHESDLTAWYPLTFDASFSPRSRFGMAITSTRRVVVAGGNEGTVSQNEFRVNDVYRSFRTTDFWTSAVIKPINDELSARVLRPKLTTAAAWLEGGNYWYEAGLTPGNYIPDQATVNSTHIVSVTGYERAATAPSDMSGYFDIHFPETNTSRLSAMTVWGTSDTGPFASGITDMAFLGSTNQVIALSGTAVATGSFDSDQHLGWTPEAITLSGAGVSVVSLTPHTLYSFGIVHRDALNEREQITLYSASNEPLMAYTASTLVYVSHIACGTTATEMACLIIAPFREAYSNYMLIYASNPVSFNQPIAFSSGFVYPDSALYSLDLIWRRAVFTGPYVWVVCGAQRADPTKGCMIQLLNPHSVLREHVFNHTLDDGTDMPPLVDIAFASPQDVGGSGRLVAVSDNTLGSVIYSDDLGVTWSAGPPFELSNSRPHNRIAWSSLFRAFIMTSNTTSEGRDYGQNSLVAWFFNSATNTWGSELILLRARAGTWGPVVWSEHFARFVVASTTDTDIITSVPPAGTSALWMRQDTPPGLYQIQLQIAKPFPEYPTDSLTLPPLQIHVLDAAVGSRTAGRTVPPMRSVHGGFGETGAIYNIRSGERAPPRLGDYNTWNGFVDHGESVDNPEDYVEYTLQGYGDNLNALPEELRITRMPDARSARRFTYVVVDKNTIRLRFYDPSFTTRRTVKLSYGEHIENEIVL